MARLSPQAIQERYRRILTAWENLAPKKSFGGYTLEQFKALTTGADMHRATLDALETQVTQAITDRDNADEVIHGALEFTVPSVQGDPSVGGSNGALYEAMGYVPKSERKSGLTRKRKPVAPPATAG
jgi:hypothetical protein